MEFVLEFAPWIWGTIFIITLVIELETSDIDAIWFSLAAFVSLLVTLLFPRLDIIWQLLIFIGVSITLLLTLGKIMKKRFRTKNISTNADALVGREIVILEDCNEFDKGSGVINDIVWTTLCQSGHSLKKGEHAIIVAIEGNKLIVKGKEEE